MILAVLTDARFTSDFRKRTEICDCKWNSYPRYLLGKILSSEYFGHTIQCVAYDACSMDNCIDKVQSCDAAIVHVDLTVRPPELVRLIERLRTSIPVMNADLNDISKTWLQRALDSRGMLTPKFTSGYNTGCVFVKSNYNAGDSPRRMYELYKHKDIPPELQTNTSFVVQRFVEEKVDRPYGLRRLRRFIIVRREVIQVEYFSTHHTIKRASSMWQYGRDISCLAHDQKLLDVRNISDLGYYYFCATPQERRTISTVVSLAKSVGLDFGVVDVVTPSRSNAYILDINPTPWERGIPDALVRLLSESISDYLNDNQD